MKYTNRYNIDPAIAKAVTSNPYQLRGDISVTGLLRPPQLAALEHQHEGDMVEDVSDGMWRLLGRAMHHIVAEGGYTEEGALKEHHLTTEVEGWTVSGTFDIYYPDGTLKDYKCTSVWRYIYGGPTEWEQQLNLYALLARRNGIEVNRLRTAMILRDWNASRAKEEEDWPPIPFIELKVKLWSESAAEAFLKNRVRLHQAARRGDYLGCNEGERWARPPTYAVQRSEKNKRAWRVFNSRTDAKALVAQMARTKGEDYMVIDRPGRNVRCEGYCPVMQWCDQAVELGVRK